MRTVLLAWVAGIWWLQQSAVLPSTRWIAVVSLVAGGGLMAVGGWFWLRSRGLNELDALRRACLLMVLASSAAVLGFTWAGHRAGQRLADALPVAMEGRDIIVTGVVASLPVGTGGGLRFVFDVDAAFLEKSRRERKGELRERAGTVDSPDAEPTRPVVAVPHRIQLVWPGQTGRNQRLVPRAGERWRLPVRLSVPRGFANWHGFDAEFAAFSQGIRATGYVRANGSRASRRSDGRRDPGGTQDALGRSAQRGAPAARRLDAGPVPGYRLAAWRERLRDDFRAALAPDARYGGVLMALALGERGDIAPDDWQIFADTGVSHLLAISGLHVSLVAGALASLAGYLWRRSFGLHVGLRFGLPLWWPAPKAAAVAGLVAAVTYGAIAGWGVPARRAVGMVAILVLALLTGRMAAPSYVLGWALAVIVALDPWSVVSPGLWLSFGAVSVLVLAGRRRNETERRRANGGGRAQPQPQPPSAVDPIVDRFEQSALARWRQGFRMRFGQAVRAQLAITLGMVPLTLAWFGTVPLLGPLANAVAIPVMTLIVTPLALLSLLLPAAAAQVALAIAHETVVWLAEGLRMLSQWPWAVWRPGIAPVWTIALASVGVAACLWPASGWVQRTGARWVTLRLTGFALLWPALLSSPQRPAAGDFRVTMLDIGQGNAVLVETATRTLLFDTGPPLGSRADAGQYVIVPYLRAQGVARLDGLIVSHAHDDHYGGAINVLKAYPSTPMISSLPGSHPVRRAAQSHRTCQSGQQWTWDGVTFRFLHPDTPTLRAGWAGRIGPNGLSCVLHIANGRHSALLAADAEAPQEQRLLTRFRRSLLHADVLLAPHHGSLTSSTPAFVKAVSPHHVVFQTGYRNRFGHPRPAVVWRYRVVGASVWHSVRHGAVRFSFSRRGIDALAYRDVHRRYWSAWSADDSGVSPAAGPPDSTETSTGRGQTVR
ncbi:DNA internalization-related competence protein ComEC/Rec2 [Pandoraea sp. PE-S2R-1]|uniref:DNA internalization-related competence protein ComEC/Rec2 n=1 Tax=Pandoraea sp. PE-S2R-1 TaxID=1986994 RepID=UPI000B40412E|nr:DNA internalization-related competence protein ComEC/Rec2 [Pandoraea sp. PE-S2R-1]